VTVLIKTTQGNSRAVNLLKRSWETSPLEGDDTRIKMVMDNGEEYVMKVSNYDILMDKLSKSDDFLALD